MKNRDTTQSLNQKMLLYFLASVFFMQTALAGIVPNEPIWKALRKNFSLRVDQSLQLETQKQIRWHRRHPHAVKDMTENAQLYLAYVYNETQKRSLPAEIALIPFIESNYNPFARSIKGASGLWQIMPDMASAHGLEINRDRDERRNVIAATETALNHLQYLKKRLHGRWDYAIAAYNAGEGRVRQAILASKRTQGKTPWTKFLPAETRKYLPKIFALKAIIERPNHYGVSLPSIDIENYFTQTPLRRSYAFQQISETCKINSDLVHRLNPEWKGHILTQERKYMILPKDQAFSCKKKLQRTPIFTNHWARHKVKKQDSLNKLATLYKTSPHAILKINNIEKHEFRSKHELIIRKNDKTLPKISHDQALNDAISSTDLLGPKQFTHRVKAKDSIQSIGKQHNVQASHIAYWNRLRYPYSLTINQELIIWKTQKPNPQYTRYVVQPGDTVSVIAQKHRTTVKRIMSASHLQNAKRIKPYQVLTIPK
jgi:membrane-bound lytic murein transglycosylase D